MLTEFPKSDSQFLKATMFQDQEIPLTFKGWEKKANKDREGKGGKPGSTWKQNLKYVLRYSYPEHAKDEAGETIMRDGKPLVNRNYDPAFPQGYTILYHFEEGQLESGSLPLFTAFCMVRPNAGDTITVNRTGIDKETKWRVKKINWDKLAQTSELPDIQIEGPHGTEEESPF